MPAKGRHSSLQGLVVFAAISGASLQRRCAAGVLDPENWSTDPLWGRSVLRQAPPVLWDGVGNINLRFDMVLARLDGCLRRRVALLCHPPLDFCVSTRYRFVRSAGGSLEDPTQRHHESRQPIKRLPRPSRPQRQRLR